MITGDIGAEIVRLLRVGATVGELPDEAAEVSAAGTWRAAPVAAGGGPGIYATSVPLALASRTGRPAERAAAYLAAGLAELSWIDSARVTGAGYVTVSVTTRHLAGLAGRIVAAGPGAATSSAFASINLTAPALADPASARDWHQAWRSYRDALTGRLAQAAGADVLFFHIQPERRSESTTQAGWDQERVGSVARAVAYHGTDAVRYALARTPMPGASIVARQLGLPLDLGNPFVAVRYAHADAASTLRWAAGLGLTQDRETAVDGSTTDHLAAPELALLDTMSWLPERVAAAARRRRPAELARYLEHLAQAWLDCRERCPALPFYGSAAPALGAGPQTTARLALAAAAQVAMASGLGLLGVSAPEQM
jgi:arginyl-tRNA synthetase